MDEDWPADYLQDLARELRRRWLFDEVTIEEVRSHLLDAAEQGQLDGMESEAAQQLALARFGSAKSVAVSFAAERTAVMQKTLLVVALFLGLSIGYVDSRPTWDDTGITVMALLISSGVLGLLGPKRPWLSALLIGIWIPLFGIITSQDYGSMLAVGLVALAFAFAGAYSGMLVRKAVMAVVTA